MHRSRSVSSAKLNDFMKKLGTHKKEFLKDEKIIHLLEEFLSDTETRYLPDDLDAKYYKNNKDS
jgi:hypothetical protein